MLPLAFENHDLVKTRGDGDGDRTGGGRWRGMRFFFFFNHRFVIFFSFFFSFFFFLDG